MASWTDKAREFVRNKQEDEYRSLAWALNLGDDPKKAYEKLSGPVMPGEHASSQRFIESMAAAGIFLDEQGRADAHDVITDIYQRFLSLKAPTEYESQNWYSSMMLTFDSLEKALKTKGYRLDSVPLLASLPTGDVNARISAVPSTGDPVLFFEQGLFRFFGDFTKVVSWCFPPMSPLEVYGDKAIRRMDTHYTMPFKASEDFIMVLGSYVGSGSTTSISHLIHEAPYNRMLASSLLQAMEWFIMGHELGHLVLGHQDASNFTDDPNTLWEREYAADLFGVELVMEIAKNNGTHWTFNYWACDVALTLFMYLFQAIEFLEFGKRQGWVSRTHPDPESRRRRLRETVHYEKFGWKDFLRSRLRLGTAAGALCGMSSALLQRLFGMMMIELMVRHRQNVRPSPIWKNLISRTFAT